MARILFGVMGDALGHVSRALAVAREMSQHEFLFVGGGKALNIKNEGYHVEEVAVPSTFYSKNRVDIMTTVSNGLKILLDQRRTIERVVQIIKSFDPHLVLTDYEFFSPIAARRLGIPSISIDHQHFLTKCLYYPPRGQALGRLMVTLPLRCMFSNADLYLITAFFKLPVLNPAESEIFPPVLRREIKGVTPTDDGGHLLVYQTSPTFHRLLPVLKQLQHHCIIYGLGEHPPSKNLTYRGPSNKGFLDDLASCRYVITNGGHNVISEALFLRKPVFSFPIHLAYEQFFNAYMLRSLGYGDYSLLPQPDIHLLEEFEKRLNWYRARIAEGDFYGNERLVAKLNRIIQNQHK